MNQKIMSLSVPGFHREYAKLKQIDWEYVKQGAVVGARLIELKELYLDENEFIQHAEQNTGMSRLQVFKLMKIASNIPLLEKHKPESIHAALVLIAKQKGRNKV